MRSLKQDQTQHRQLQPTTELSRNVTKVLRDEGDFPVVIQDTKRFLKTGSNSASLTYVQS